MTRPAPASVTPPPDVDGAEDFDNELDDLEDIGFDCHMMADGQCLIAGSEDCDFECPYMALQRAAVKRGSWHP